MNQRLLSLLGAVALTACVLTAARADQHGADNDGPMQWFDPMRCVICEPIEKSPGLMEVMQWESHKIDNGVVMISTMPADKVEQFREACGKMDAISRQVAAGEIEGAKCCGFCDAFGAVLAAGAKMQKVDTRTGQVVIVTSGEGGVVGQIHAMADQTAKEMKKMMAAEG